MAALTGLRVADLNWNRQRKQVAPHPLQIHHIDQDTFPEFRWRFYTQPVYGHKNARGQDSAA